MKVVSDLDDVVVDFFGRVVDCYNKEFAATLTIEDVTGWDNNPIKLSPHFGEGKAFPNWWAWWEARANLWGDADAIDGSIGGLYELHAQGHSVELLTSKPFWSRKAFLKWMATWNPYFDKLTIVEEGSTTKKVDVTDGWLLIDDRPKNVIEWTKAGRPAILFDRPWNQSYIPRVRAKNWDDVLMRVEQNQQGINQLDDDWRKRLF